MKKQKFFVDSRNPNALLMFFAKDENGRPIFQTESNTFITVPRMDLLEETSKCFSPKPLRNGCMVLVVCEYYFHFGKKFHVEHVEDGFAKVSTEFGTTEIPAIALKVL